MCLGGARPQDIPITINLILGLKTWPSEWEFVGQCAAVVMLLGGSNSPWQDMCVLNMLDKMFLCCGLPLALCPGK